MSTGIDSYVSAVAQHAATNYSQSGKLSSNPALLNSPADRKLRAAAAEFESMLLSDLWKSMKSSIAGTDDDSMDPAHDTLEDWGVQAMSTAVGKAGGLGIGKLIVKYLEPKLAQSQNGNDPASTKVSHLPADSSQ